MTSTVTKSAHDLIKQILAAKHIGQVVDLTNFDDDFNSIAKLIHPDLCHEANAVEAIKLIKVNSSVTKTNKGALHL